MFDPRQLSRYWEGMKDRIFTDPARGERPFEFDKTVSAVFDDMAVRSIPCYQELQFATRELVLAAATTGSAVYDIGCSTGTLLQLLAPPLRSREIRLVGIDSSAEMLQEARLKLGEEADWVTLERAPAHEARFESASAIVMNYTLQFVPITHRTSLLARIAKSLRPGGLLVLSEKTCFDSEKTQEHFDSLYYAFKRRNGYSEAEIEAKRRSLTGVLVPQTIETHQNNLQAAGFQLPEIFLQGYQFVSMIARTAS